MTFEEVAAFERKILRDFLQPTLRPMRACARMPDGVSNGLTAKA